MKVNQAICFNVLEILSMSFSFTCFESCKRLLQKIKTANVAKTIIVEKG